MARYRQAIFASPPVSARTVLSMPEATPISSPLTTPSNPVASIEKDKMTFNSHCV